MYHGYSPNSCPLEQSFDFCLCYPNHYNMVSTNWSFVITPSINLCKVYCFFLIQRLRKGVPSLVFLKGKGFYYEFKAPALARVTASLTTCSPSRQRKIATHTTLCLPLDTIAAMVRLPPTVLGRAPELQPHIWGIDSSWKISTSCALRL
jgi:hypothetical protein